MKESCKKSSDVNLAVINGIKIIESKTFPFSLKDGTTFFGVIYGSDGKPVYLIDPTTKKAP